MATSGAVSSGQGDLEPDGQAVLSVCRILRKPTIGARWSGRGSQSKGTSTLGSDPR